MENDFVIRVEKEDAGVRIDKLLADKAEGLTRSHIQKLISEQQVTVCQNAVKANYKVREGDIVSVLIPELKEPEIEAEDIPIEIVYEDDDMLVVDKPQGMVVHPAAGNYSGTLVNALL